jgi:CDP-paratose 2-epimerase
MRVVRKGWRPGDQKVYVCDIRRARRELGWSPKMGVKTGLGRLWDWLAAEREGMVEASSRTP